MSEIDTMFNTKELTLIRNAINKYSENLDKHARRKWLNELKDAAEQWDQGGIDSSVLEMAKIDITIDDCRDLVKKINLMSRELVENIEIFDITEEL